MFVVCFGILIYQFDAESHEMGISPYSHTVLPSRFWYIPLMTPASMLIILNDYWVLFTIGNGECMVQISQNRENIPV